MRNATMCSPMSRIRLVLAWLLITALPLQGFAAASMLFCGAEFAVTSHTSGDGHVGHAHDEAALAGAHDHASHGHASQGHAKAGNDSGKAAKADPDKQGHACPVCASCCQVAAVSNFEPFPQTVAPPSVEPSSAVVRVATRVATVPDKPPRA